MQSVHMQYDDLLSDVEDLEKIGMIECERFKSQIVIIRLTPKGFGVVTEADAMIVRMRAAFS